MIAKIKKFSIQYFLTQFTITLVSLPILIQWGISISAAGLAGNLLFLPFLAAFLFGCSILFILSLVDCTCSAIYIFLEWIVSFWKLILAQGSTTWLISFAAPPTLLCWIIPVISLTYLITSKHAQSRKTGIITGLLITQLALLQLYTWNQQKNKSSCKLLPKIDIIYEPSIGIIINDRGLLKKYEIGMNIVPYKLMPALIKTYGTRTIEYLILEPGTGSFMHALQLCSFAQIKTIIVPKTEKTLSKKTWFHFFELKRFCTENNIPLLRSAPRNIINLLDSQELSPSPDTHIQKK